MKVRLMILVAALVLAGCAPSAASIGTAIAQTQSAAPTVAPTTAPTATLTMVPATPTATATSTPTNTSTATSTSTTTPSPTPTIPAQTATPTATGTPSQAQRIQAQIANSAYSLKFTLNNMLAGINTGITWCSVEVNQSEVTNYERLLTYPAYDDALLTTYGKDLNYHYRVALGQVRDDSNIQAMYNGCKDWIARGKPPTDNATNYNWNAAIAILQSSLAILKQAFP
jgi:hypothetical protein